jgi:hypothetical protein
MRKATDSAPSRAHVRLAISLKLPSERLMRHIGLGSEMSLTVQPELMWALCGEPDTVSLVDTLR